MPGETPDDRSFLVDGETRTFDMTYRRGVTDDIDVGIRLPLRWRGGGVLDGLIDWYHGLVGLRGKSDGDRPAFRRDAFRFEGVTTANERFSWDDDDGFGLGDLELETRWRFQDGGRDGWSAALAARAGLPTGTAPFDGNGGGFGLQLVTAKRLASSVDVFVGAGATVESGDLVRGVGYEPVRGHAFLAFEWRPGRSWSLVAETDAATRLIRDVERYPGTHWIVNAGARFDLSRRTRLDLGFTENFKSQIATTDFGMHAAIVVSP